MAKKNHYEMNLEIHTRVTELNLYIEELHQKINMLMTHEDSIKSDDEVEALKAIIEALKKDQEDVKKRFNEFIIQSYQSDDVKDLQVLTNIDEELEDLKTRIEGYKEEQEYLNTRFNELMIEFGISKDFGGSGISTGTEGQKEEDYVSEGLIELATGFVRSGHTSNVDLEVSTVIEEFKKNEGNVKGRLLEKLRGADLSDDMEDVSSDSEGFSTNIQGLDQEMRELMHGSDKSEGSKKGGNVKKSNEEKKSRNSRLEKVMSDQSGYIDLNAYTSIKGLKGKLYRLMDEERKSKKGGTVKKLNQAQKSRNSRLEKVISDQSGYIELNAYTSVKGLEGKRYGLMHGERKSKGTLIEYGQFDNVDLGVCTNIEGLEQKMSSLMHECKDGLEKDVNKRLKEWLKECDDSDEEWKAPKTVKARATELATRLSQQLVDLMFLMSEWKEVLANFQEVKSFLQWVIEDENSLVLNKIISLMELVDKEIRKMKETEKVKSESLEGSSVNMEEIDQFIDQFIKEVLRLEYILKHHGLPESQMLNKDVLASLESGLEECEKELKAIEMKLNELKAMSSFIFRPDGSEINEIWRRAVGLKIKELWNESEETDGEKEERE